jgi:hypothetical protein
MVFGGIARFSRRDDHGLFVMAGACAGHPPFGPKARNAWMSAPSPGHDEEEVSDLGTGDDVREEPEGMLE